jgi:hypothetical protein
MKIKFSQLRRIIREQLSHLSSDVSTVGIEVEWYPPPRDEETEGQIFVVPLDVAKQGDEVVRDYIDSTFYPRYKYIFSKGGADEIDKAINGELDR